MSAKGQRLQVHCPYCGMVGYVRVREETGDPRGAIVHCPRCAASVHVVHGDYRIEGRVEGESGEEVSKVVTQLVPGSGKGAVTVTISQSTIGMLNTGEIEDVQAISVNIAGLADPNVAQALKYLTEAVANSQELPTDERSQALDQLAELSRQAALSPDERAKPGVVKALLAGVAATIGAAGGLAEVWSTWGPAIKAFFGR